eukprot:7379197-Prymnesium_polylepis.1
MREAAQTHSSTARTGGTQQSRTSLDRSLAPNSTQRRMRVCRAWQQALSAVECTDAHAGRLHAKLTLGRDARSSPLPQPAK